MVEFLRELIHDYKLVGREAVKRRIRGVLKDPFLERRANGLPILFTGLPFSSGMAEGEIWLYSEENSSQSSVNQHGIVVVSGQTLYKNPLTIISQAKGCITNCSMGSHVGIITREQGFPAVTVDTDDINEFVRVKGLLGKRVIIDGKRGKVFLDEKNN